MKKTMVAVLISVAALSACSSGDATTTVATSRVATTTVAATTVASSNPQGPLTVMEIAERLRAAINDRDETAVAAMTPTANPDIREFLIGGGPYDWVECYVFNGKDECHVINGIADFVFTVDVDSGLITEVTYVGGA